jgi:hypothetical protein
VPTTRYFLRNTQTEPGTGGSGVSSVRDLSTTQGTGTTVTTGNFSHSIFANVHHWTRTVGAGVVADGTQNYAVSVDVNSVTSEESDLEYRFRVCRRNSSGTLQANSGYSSTFTTAGIKTATLSMNAGTWAAGDRLSVEVEARIPSALDGSIVFNVNDADSYVDAENAAAAGGKLLAQIQHYGMAI